MRFGLYIDEDSMDGDFVSDLRRRGFDVITAFEQGMTERSDEEQLEFALSIGRVIFTCNVKDFSRLHKDFLTQGKNHAGIIVMHQKRYSIGEQVQRLQRLALTRSAEEMENTLQYLSNIAID